MNFYIITLFPKQIKSFLNFSILKRAREKKILNFHFINLRKFGLGKHKKVDDRPFGGGPGMVLMIEPIFKAVLYCLGIKTKKNFKKDKINLKKIKPKDTCIVLFSTRGEVLNQKLVKKLLKYKNLILICGHYEGVDERVAKYIADKEISVGDFVLTGGEIPALILIDVLSRFVPGVLGKFESLEEIKGSYPTYTRPVSFNGWDVPKVLLSGNHLDIKKWRKFGWKKQKN